MTINQQNSEGGFLSYVVKITAESEPKSITCYAVGSLVETLGRYGITTFDAESLRVWIASMLLSGVKTTTAKRYTGRLHTIFNEWRETDVVDPFLDVNSAFEPSFQVNEADETHNLNVLKRLLGRTETDANRQSALIFFYLLYNADASLLDVVEATFDGAPNYCAQVDEIVKQLNSSYGRKYLFSLNQSKARPTQILRELTEALGALMKSAGMRVANGHVREEITAIWIAAALKCGIDLRDIRSVVAAVPYRYRALSLISKQEIATGRRHEIICRVADSLNDNTPRWFAMKLRRVVSVDDVKSKIEAQLPGRLATMELFHPTHIAKTRVGKKIQRQEVAYAPDIVFFRTQYNKVRSLFAAIGDIAWCFKASQTPDARYAIISQEEMVTFQRCVGQFTDDIKLQLTDPTQTLGLGLGRMVRITGGMMAGYTGLIEDLDTTTGSRRFYLRISADTALNWTATVPDYLIEPLEG